MKDIIYSTYHGQQIAIMLNQNNCFSLKILKCTIKLYKVQKALSSNNTLYIYIWLLLSFWENILWLLVLILLLPYNLHIARVFVLNSIFVRNFRLSKSRLLEIKYITYKIMLFFLKKKKKNQSFTKIWGKHIKIALR